MKHYQITVGKKRIKWLRLMLILGVLAPLRLWAAPPMDQRGDLTDMEPALHQDAPSREPDDRADPDLQQPDTAVEDTELRHAAPQDHFRSEDDYFPSDDELRLWYRPGSRRPLWGY